MNMASTKFVRCVVKKLMKTSKYTIKNGFTTATSTVSTHPDKPKTDKFDKDGMPLDLFTWGRLMEDRDYTRINVTEIGPYFFSTVWMGLDHSFGEGPPLIFESMAFKNRKSEQPNDREDIYQDRYSTLNRARLGHFKMIIIVLWKEFTAYLWDVGNHFIKAIKNLYRRF